MVHSVIIWIWNNIILILWENGYERDKDKSK